jgi:hypothetical protein
MRYNYISATLSTFFFVRYLGAHHSLALLTLRFVVFLLFAPPRFFMFYRGFSYLDDDVEADQCPFGMETRVARLKLRKFRVDRLFGLAIGCSTLKL